MDKLIIEGGVPLTGVVHVSGSKTRLSPSSWAASCSTNP